MGTFYAGESQGALRWAEILTERIRRHKSTGASLASQDIGRAGLIGITHLRRVLTVLRCTFTLRAAADDGETHHRQVGGGVDCAWSGPHCGRHEAQSRNLNDFRL